jgi:hypothetical protein
VVHILSQMNPVHTLPSYLFKNDFSIYPSIYTYLFKVVSFLQALHLIMLFSVIHNLKFHTHTKHQLQTVMWLLQQLLVIVKPKFHHCHNISPLVDHALFMFFQAVSVRYILRLPSCQGFLYLTFLIKFSTHSFLLFSM